MMLFGTKTALGKATYARIVENHVYIVDPDDVVVLDKEQAKELARIILSEVT